jgi:ribosomal-protein-alanine N-acetyltransferase
VALAFPELPIDLARLRLRSIEDSDIDAMFAIYADREVSRYLSFPPMTARAEAEAFVGRIRAGYENGSSWQLAVERREDGALIGTCILFHFHEQSRRAEIGYTLGRPHWSQGYMREALDGLIGIAFGALDLNRLEADIDPRNEPSARILERLGFRREGHLVERWIVAGEKSDTVYYGLLRRDWKKMGTG